MKIQEQLKFSRHAEDMRHASLHQEDWYWMADLDPSLVRIMEAQVPGQQKSAKSGYKQIIKKERNTVMSSGQGQKQTERHCTNQLTREVKSTGPRSVDMDPESYDLSQGVWLLGKEERAISAKETVSKKINK